MNSSAPEPRLATDEHCQTNPTPVELHALLSAAGAGEGMSVEWVFEHFQTHREPEQ